jgi:4-hydroxybenzoate polyprenyltransferase
MSDQASDPGRPSMLRTVLVLGRTSNLPTVWTNVLAGWFLAGGEWDWPIAWLALAVSALYLGGMTLNDAFDVKWDREHAPERPVPSGAISVRGVWMLGWGWMVAGVGLAWLVTDAGMGWVAGLLAAILLYDWIHKKWSGAMWVMGACRSLVYVVAGSAVTDSDLSSPAWLGGVLGLYVAAITLLARSERNRAAGQISFRKLANVLLLAPLVAVGVFMVGFPAMTNPVVGNRNLQVWAMMGTYWGWSWVTGKARLGENIGSGVTALLAGIVVVDALFVSLVDWRAALVCLAFLPIVRWLQMRIPAT